METPSGNTVSIAASELLGVTIDAIGSARLLYVFRELSLHRTAGNPFLEGLSGCFLIERSGREPGSEREEKSVKARALSERECCF